MYNNIYTYNGIYIIYVTYFCDPLSQKGSLVIRADQAYL